MSDHDATRVSLPFTITTFPVDEAGNGVLTVTNDGFDLRVTVDAAKWKPVDVYKALLSIADGLAKNYPVAPPTTQAPPAGLLQ